MEQITPEWIMSKVAAGKPFSLVLLKVGLPEPADKDEATRIQMQHLAYLFKLEQQKDFFHYSRTTDTDIKKPRRLSRGLYKPKGFR